MSDKNTNIQELDVRTLIPIERHKKLIQLFKELPAGESFIFINDHDPIPLYYEFRSIYGDVVGWDYLNRGGRDWKVKVTRTEDSIGREFTDISTLMDLRKADEKEWRHVIFHRYGMMEQGDTMEVISNKDLVEIHNIFIRKFEGKHKWIYKKKEDDEFVVHITKVEKSGLGDDGFSIVHEMDLRPYPPTERHEMFYKAFADIKPGEAFEFVNDHDPKPLYYQMEAESKESFRWEYVEQGPEQWKVRVIKTKE
ncbi:MAG TPA: DUF2249 domain-containing protein [Candidatus Sphingobacterium stercoripullorum]|uniref:DUF2249 domain-containing protein n=1 Tax=Candidatus Sphingobacterium stercoripullorum TaxID=2838759 RepID=A0A9D1WCH2_9SPHI|nr:DUF2249 domain-containing protein [Candidatus Sphingobacterium stercoripullorum]